MTIPDELRVALAKDYVRENFQTGEPWSATISRAILAERQRCADIAKKVAEEAYGDTSAIGAAALIRGRIMI